jgi:hypothetical protein
MFGFKAVTEGSVRALITLSDAFAQLLKRPLPELPKAAI